jgi:hypothetical protein
MEAVCEIHDHEVEHAFSNEILNERLCSHEEKNKQPIM